MFEVDQKDFSMFKTFESPSVSVYSGNKVEKTAKRKNFLTQPKELGYCVENFWCHILEQSVEALKKKSVAKQVTQCSMYNVEHGVAIEEKEFPSLQEYAIEMGGFLEKEMVGELAQMVGKISNEEYLDTTQSVNGFLCKRV